MIPCWCPAASTTRSSSGDCRQTAPAPPSSSTLPRCLNNTPALSRCVYSTCTWRFPLGSFGFLLSQKGKGGKPCCLWEAYSSLAVSRCGCCCCCCCCCCLRLREWWCSFSCDGMLTVTLSLPLPLPLLLSGVSSFRRVNIY